MSATSTEVVDRTFHCMPNGALAVADQSRRAEQALNLRLGEAQPHVGVLYAHPLIRMLDRVCDRDPPARSRHPHHLLKHRRGS